MDDAENFALGKKYYNDIARESRQYAKSCYDLNNSQNPASGPDACSFLYKPSIKYLIFDNDVCPFTNATGHMCREGENGAFTASTGDMSTGATSDLFVDASELGINSPLRYKFHRSITCAPLLEDGLIQKFNNEDGTLGHRYFYGRRSGDWNCTADLPHCTFEVMSYPDMNQPYSMLQVPLSKTGLHQSRNREQCH